MIDTYKKIKVSNKPQFSMPLSLQIIKECGKNGIYYKDLHFIDLLSIFYSIRIDNANQYLESERRDKMQKRGISEIKQATMEDFDSL